MSYYQTCPDCRDDLRDQLESAIMDLTESECAILLKVAKIRKRHPAWTPEECVAAASVTSTDGGGVEHGDFPVPSYHN